MNSRATEGFKREIMTYKERKKENELILKLEIIRKVFVQKKLQVDISKAYSCGKNTISRIVRDFKSKISEEKKRVVLNPQKSFSIEEIEELLLPMSSEITRPKSNKRSASMEQEALILRIFKEKKVRVGARRMFNLLQRMSKNSDFGFDNEELELLKKLSWSQIRGIYKRHKLRSKKVRSTNRQRKPLYDYKKIAVMSHLHIDTKVLADQKALPREIYEKFKHQKDLPLYEWNIMDVRSRFRFIAYSRGHTSYFGFRFLLLVLQYIRANNLCSWNIPIKIGTDNGSEFFSGSERKKDLWNKYFSKLNASIYAYNPGFDVRKNLIERSHKTDDEEFLIPAGFGVSDRSDFMDKAQKYSNYFNFQRLHSGIEMHNRTPFEVIRDAGITHPEKLFKFPTLYLDDCIADIRSATDGLMTLVHSHDLQYNFSVKKTHSIFQRSLIIKQSPNVLTHYLNATRG